MTGCRGGQLGTEPIPKEAHVSREEKSLRKRNPGCLWESEKAKLSVRYKGNLFVALQKHKPCQLDLVSLKLPPDEIRKDT